MALAVTGVRPAVDETEVRRLGPALVQGAVRGLLAGLVPGGLALAGFGFLNRFEGAELLVGIPALTALFGAIDAACVRIRGNAGRIALKVVAGLFAPVVAGVPAFAVHAWAVERKTPWEVAGQLDMEFAYLVVGVLAVAAAIAGLLVSGTARRNASWLDVLIRSAKGGFASGFVGSLAFLVDPGALCCGIPLGVFAAVTFATLLGIGHLLAAPAGRRVGRWLEPGTSGLDRIIAGARYDEELRASLGLEREASLEKDEAAALEKLGRALGHAQGALEAAQADDRLVFSRAGALRRVAELALRLGRPDELDRAFPGTGEPDILRAEMKRVAGELDAAIRLAETTGKRAKGANLHALLALAYFDKGDKDRAVRELALARVAQRWTAPLLDRFLVANVALALEKKRAS